MRSQIGSPAMHGSLKDHERPDYAAAAQRMAEAIEAFLRLPEFRTDKQLCRFIGRPQYFDLIVARRRYLDECEGRARIPGDPLNGHQG
jgi:hypothetical protein